MRIIIEGSKNGNPKSYIYNLLDRFEKESGTISMARTTGYTCTAVTNLILDGMVPEKGIIPPENLGKNSNNFNFILAYLKQRGVNYMVEEK